MSEKLADKLKGTIVEREIFNDSVAIDGRGGELSAAGRADFVKDVYKNTKKFLLENGVLVPIKKGHFDQDEDLKGQLVGIKLKRKKGADKDSDRYSIVGRMFLSTSMFEQYNEGRFPSVSVEIAEQGFLSDGSEFGAHIFAVALLGTNAPALPDLQDFQKIDNELLYARYKSTKQNYEKGASMPDFDAFVEMVTKDIGDFLRERYKDDDSETVDEEVVEDMAEELSEAPEAKTELASEEKPEDEEDKEMAEKVDSDDFSKQVTAEQKAQAARLEKIESDLRKREHNLVFSQLHQQGKVVTQQKSHFMKVAESMGVEEAKNVFGAMPIQAQPPTENLGSEKGQYTDERSELAKQAAKKLNLSNVLSRMEKTVNGGSK